VLGAVCAVVGLELFAGLFWGFGETGGSLDELEAHEVILLLLEAGSMAILGFGECWDEFGMLDILRRFVRGEVQHGWSLVLRRLPLWFKPLALDAILGTDLNDRFVDNSVELAGWRL
jgi:hypothetical protein